MCTPSELLQHRAVDIAIIDLARAGGITPWRRIAALAQAITCRCVATSSGNSRPPAVGHSSCVHGRECAALGGNLAADAGTGGWLSGGSKTPGLGLELDDTAVTATASAEQMAIR